jgi:hypothetical protein
MRKSRKSLILGMAVAALGSGQSLPNIRDGMEPLEIPEPSLVFKLLPYFAVLLILAVLIWLKFRSPSARGNAESAEADAQRRLAGIAHTTSRVFYAELHSIFVEYLESSVHIKASRCTTPELLHILAGLDLIGAEWRASVEEFLADCDRAKFSSWQPDRAPDEAVAECKALITQVATAPRLATGIGRPVNELV